MRRALVPLLVVLGALLAAGPTAGAVGPRRAVYIEFYADGFHVQVKSALDSGRVRLLLYRGGEVAYYYVPAKVGVGTVRARFGHLGSLDLRFTPGRGEGALGCGEGDGWQRGTFRGAFVFDGEHHYVQVREDRMRGYFQTYPAASCARGGRREKGSPATASRAHEVAETGAELTGATASRLPGSAFYFFTVDRPAGVQVVFDAFRYERREGMRIERGAQMIGGAATFHWNLVAGTATVEPPAPFSGRAFFRPRKDGRSSWRGSLRAPVLGAKPMRLTGSAFRTHLGPVA